MFGPFATAAAFLRLRAPLAVDMDQRCVQVLRTTWTEGIAGAEKRLRVTSGAGTCVTRWPGPT
eukprot:5362349-Alexandrium_andersonii.AAC.1